MLLIVSYFFIVGSLLITLVGDSINLQSDLYVNIFIAITSIILLAGIIVKKDKKNGIKNFNLMLLLSYFIRVLFMYWDRYFRHIFTFPNSGLDTGSFHGWATEYISNGMSGQKGYSAVLGWIYRFFYPNPLWGQYINVIASIFTILVFYEILCSLDIESKYKTYGLMMICFLPNYLIMSSILLRESIITLFLTLSIYFLMKWWNHNKLRDILISIAWVLAATYLHSGTIAYIVGILIVVAFAGNNQREFKFKFSTLMSLIVSIAFLMFIYSNFSNTFFGYMGGINSVEDLVNKSESYASGGSAYSVSIIDNDSILGLVVNSPIRIFYFLSSPLPWGWRGLNDIIAFFGNSLFYSMSIYYGIKSLKHNKIKNKNIIISMLIIALCSAFIYSWGVSNSGTALRHRDKFLPNFTLLLIISLDAISNFKKVNKRNKLEIYQ